MSLSSTSSSPFSTLPGNLPRSTRTSHGPASVHLHPQSTQSTSPQSMRTMATVKTPPKSASIHLSRISQNTVSPWEAQQVLTNAFTADDYFEGMENLTGWKIDPQGYIDGLDRVCAHLFILTDSMLTTVPHQLMDALEPGSKIYCRSLRALQRTCGIYGLLPASHFFSERLSLVTHGQMKRPLASGGYYDVWQARNDGGQIFAVRQLRTYETDNLRRAKKVPQFCD